MWIDYGKREMCNILNYSEKQDTGNKWPYIVL